MSDQLRPLPDARWGTETDRNGLVVLDRAECLRLLASVTLGRIGLTTGALPVVLPVNFWFDGSRILIHTGPGTMLAAATRDAVVAFEVDEMDAFWHTGWSVLATGVAHHITDAEELRRVVDLPIPRWAPRGGGHVVAITPELISGRRIEAGANGQRVKLDG
ncbi:MAG: pyridoxamine 5'-phosphate oxidase family protein [Acidimicrobiales bacterium]